MIWIAEKSIDAKLNLEVNDDQSTDATAKATDVKEFPPTGGNNNPGFIHLISWLSIFLFTPFKYFWFFMKF